MSTSALPRRTPLPISLPQPLGFEAFKSLFQVCSGLPFIPVGRDRGIGRAQRTTMRLSCPKAPGHGWMGPFLPHSLTFPTLTPLLLLGPFFHTSTSHLYKRTCPLPLPSFLACFLICPRLYPAPRSPPTPNPSPGQADVIGASSLRDPVPYLSLVCLLFLTPPSVPFWTPEPKSQC